MEWMIWILLVSALWVTIQTGYRVFKKYTLARLALFLALIAFDINIISELLFRHFTQDLLIVEPNLISEWAQIISISFVLSGLAVIIREAKPDFARFPLSFAFLPLLIIATYPMAMHTLVIKKWLLSIYEGGALLVALLLYSVKTYRFNKYGLILLGIILMTLAYLFFWFNFIPETIKQTWPLLMALGLYISSRGFKTVAREWGIEGESWLNTAEPPNSPA